MISADERRDQRDTARAPTIPCRRNELARNGCISASATVKITNATMNPVTSISNPLRTSEATIRPTALATSSTRVLTSRRIMARTYSNHDASARPLPAKHRALAARSAPADRAEYVAMSATTPSATSSQPAPETP